jgi:hypothetical protein
MVATKEPTIVAELGRPETPDETAQRKAETSRKHRAGQTTFNLIVALIASLGVVLFLVVVVVRPDPAPTAGVDFAATAEQAQADAEAPLIVPTLDSGWSANAARFETVAAVPTWYIGFITPTTQFIALNQGIGANDTWLATVLDEAEITGVVTIEGVQWDVYDQRESEDPGNHAYSMSTEASGFTIVLHGTAPTAEFDELAASIGLDLETP